MATTSKKFIDFEIQVLTSGFWPFQQNSPLNQFALPFELEHCVDRFTSFYNGLHSGRKLNWLFQLSKGELVTNGFKNRYIFQALSCLPCPPSSRCGSPSRSTTSAAHPLSTGSASKCFVTANVPLSCGITYILFCPVMYITNVLCQSP